jgi:hypothetical protein
MQYLNILHVSYVHIKYNRMAYLELSCNLMLTCRSEIVKVPFIDVLNLRFAVYCTIRLHSVYLITFCSRLKFKLLLSVFGIMLDLEIQLLLVFTEY